MRLPFLHEILAKTMQRYPSVSASIDALQTPINLSDLFGTLFFSFVESTGISLIVLKIFGFPIVIAQGVCLFLSRPHWLKAER